MSPPRSALDPVLLLLPHMGGHSVELWLPCSVKNRGERSSEVRFAALPDWRE